MQNDISNFILALYKRKISSKRDFLACQRDFCRGTEKSFFTNDKLLEAYHNLLSNKIITHSFQIEKLLTLKETRSLSGIVVISVLTKSFPCPGKCLYCPSQINVPKSYLANEPAVMRAITCKIDPFTQVTSRLKALKAVGHATDKINIRIIGGTWSSYPKQYQTWFVKSLFAAANKDQNNELRIVNNGKTIQQLQYINETAGHRIVEISVETRQDYIDKKEIIRLRELGVTKVELGVQSIYDKVLQFNHRGNLNIDTISATRLLKLAGFKVSYQMMLNLPKSDAKMDVEMFEKLFSDPDFMPDHLKIYPLALVKEAPIYELYKQGQFKPYTKEELIGIIKNIKKYIPYYCRVERVIRDIPAEYIVEGGSKVSNLRQEIQLQMDKEGLSCNCIRCREVRATYDADEKEQLFCLEYESSAGKEYFLSIESPERKKLYSMLRLTIPNEFENISFKTLKNAAIVREIHTYGPQVAIRQFREDAVQHKGFGKKLLAEAERIAKTEPQIEKMAVIAGVGVREYFKKQGYVLEETYMIKLIK